LEDIFMPLTERIMFKRIYALLAITFLMISGETIAESNLSIIVEKAYKHHPERHLAKAQQALGMARKDKANQLLASDPSFNVKYQSDALGSDDGYREWEGGVDLPLWWPGQRAALNKEAERTLEFADAMEFAKRLEVAGVVRERLWQWALANSANKNAQLAYDSAVELEKNITRRIQAGELAESDRLLARLETLRRKDELSQAIINAKQSEAHFLNYTHLEKAPQPVAETPVSKKELLEAHPLLKLTNSKVLKARAHRDRVAAERNSGTSLWLGGKRTRDMYGDDYDSALGLELSIPFGSKAQAAPGLAEAEEQLTAALAEQSYTHHELSNNLKMAQLNYQRTKEALVQAKLSKSIADEALRLHHRAFELGEADLVRLLHARREALAARHAFETRRLEVGQTIAKLNQAIGVLPK
jgi:outer membrane protein TolC